MSKAKLELAVNLAIAGIFIIYILSLNPISYIYLRNHLRSIRWWLWNANTPAWFKEALQVRGYLQ